MIGQAGGLTYRGINLDTTNVPSGVVDQVGPTGTATSSGIKSDGPGGVGQTVTFGASPTAVTGLRMNLIGSGTRFGMIRAVVYAEDGSDLPTGAPLVFSPFYGFEDMSTSADEYFFPLSGWTPTASTKYVFALEPYNYFRFAGHGFGLRSATGGYAGGMYTKSATESPSQIDAQNTGWATASATDLDFTVYSVSGSAGGGGASAANILIRAYSEAIGSPQKDPVVTGANNPIRSYQDT